MLAPTSRLDLIVSKNKNFVRFYLFKKIFVPLRIRLFLPPFRISFLTKTELEIGPSGTTSTLITEPSGLLVYENHDSDDTSDRIVLVREQKYVSLLTD